VEPPVLVAVELGRLAGAEARPALQPLLVEIDDIAAAVGIVVERVPRQRNMVVAEPEQAAERHHRIVVLAASLVGHEALDPAEPLAVFIVDGGALDPVRRDQAPRPVDRVPLARAGLFHDAALRD
jgi:hypothetical protein